MSSWVSATLIREASNTPSGGHPKVIMIHSIASKCKKPLAVRGSCTHEHPRGVWTAGFEDQTKQDMSTSRTLTASTSPERIPVDFMWSGAVRSFSLRPLFWALHCLYSLLVPQFKYKTKCVLLQDLYHTWADRAHTWTFVRLAEATDPESCMQAPQFATLDPFYTKLFRIAQFSLIMHCHKLLV